jgi:hypothetical protein
MNAINQELPLNAVQIDALCFEFEEKKQAAELAVAALSEIKAQLIDRVEKQGYVPSNAEKSKRLDGVIWVATTTTGSTVEVKTESVVKLQLELSRLKKPRLFAKLFARQVKYSLVKDAADALKLALASLAAAKKAPVLALFSSCFDVNSKTPSLSVDSISAVKAKEEKAAKKAAGKGRK